MTENLSFIIILEFVAPFAILSIILLIALLNGNKKNKKGLVKLLDAVQNGEKDYQQKLLEFLKKSAIKDEDLDDIIHKFTRSRRDFFKQTLSAMSNGDTEHLEGLSGRFGVFSDLYHQLEIEAISESIDEDVEDVEGSSIEDSYKVVKRENKRLKAEAHVSVSALNGLFKEYASMFGEVPDNKGELTVQEILDSMKKFTKGDFKPEGVVKDSPPELDSEKSSSTTANEDDDTADTIEPDDDSLEIAVEKADEPDWGDAFDETGEAPDESAKEQFEKSQQEATEKAEDSDEPDWGEAFDETGETPDESAMEQFEESQQEGDKKSQD